MPSLLVIVPCGQAKIWRKEPGLGLVKAKFAYVGAPFKVNRAFAEKFSNKPSDKWLILSAKYGFLEPDSRIEDYNVTFKRPNPKQIKVTELKKQAHEKGLKHYEIVVALGGKDYSSKVKEVFAGCKVFTPVTGLPLGIGMNRIKALQKLSREEMLQKIAAL